jgi:putative SOS response-associated peptidase YedK
MCGRYSLEFDEEFYKRYRLVNKLQVKTSYNITPGQIMPVIIAQSPNSMSFMLWGLIPIWEEKKDKPSGLINIRSDTVLNRTWAYKYIQFQRCLVPTTGFFEWKRTNNVKQPYYFYLKNKKYFSFAGIYSEWKNPKNNKVIKSYAIITTFPNTLMQPIHNRMPVILKEEDEDEWLNPDLIEVEKIKEFLKPYSTNNLETYTISTRINNPAFNNKELLKPL